MARKWNEVVLKFFYKIDDGPLSANYNWKTANGE